jgi:hypothetical protein
VTPAEARALLTRCPSCETLHYDSDCAHCEGTNVSPEREEALRLLLQAEREAAEAAAGCLHCIGTVVSVRPEPPSTEHGQPEAVDAGPREALDRLETLKARKAARAAELDTLRAENERALLRVEAERERLAAHIRGMLDLAQQHRASSDGITLPARSAAAYFEGKIAAYTGLLAILEQPQPSPSEPA